MSHPGIVSLLTDFGHDDEYVGIMKAVILRYSPTTTLVDICHTIAPQDIRSAARMLEVSYPFFIEGTVHLAVVDPGVGTERSIIAVESGRHLFVAPDNGILSAIIKSSKLTNCYRLSALPTVKVSSTFHGRDIMAPAAGKLAAGTPISELGDKIAPEQCVILPSPIVQISEKEIIGEVVAIDHFGNIATSIKTEHICLPYGDVKIEICGVSVSGIVNTYAKVETLSLAALIDSRGNLEIAMNHGNAAKHLGCKQGDSIIIRSASSKSSR